MELILIGIVTSLSALSVNGVALDQTSTTRYTLNGREAAPSALTIGDFVEVRATTGEARPRAVSVAIVNAAVGPVTAKYGDADVFDIVGERVKLLPQTVFDPGVSRERLKHAGPQDRFRVSGLRVPDGGIIATRIEAAEASARMEVAGPLEEPPSGARFVVEGYVSGDAAQGRFGIDGMGFAIDPDLGTHLAPGALVRVSGHVETSGARTVERAEFLDSPFAKNAAGGVGAAASPPAHARPRPRAAGEPDRPERPRERPQRGEITGH